MKCIEPDCGAEYEPREVQVGLGNFFGVRPPGRCPPCLQAYRDAEPERLPTGSPQHERLMSLAAELVAEDASSRRRAG
ncbi:hypothetical protein LCGC14_2820390 [marine sediment metagenome]|uniref:Uncharacterized protein n=1 Tax=marine sediment metagenome TaxID=412755 RepID=A0A0F8YH21_9ZZZZ